MAESKENKLKSINFKLDIELHRKFKIYVADKGITMQDFIVNAIKEKVETNK